jgi:hypothetical protein
VGLGGRDEGLRLGERESARPAIAALGGKLRVLLTRLVQLFVHFAVQGFMQTRVHVAG